MTWRDSVALATRSIMGRLGRALLTVAAVMLATALLVALAIIVDTGNSRVIRQLSKGGPITAIRVTGGTGRLDEAARRNLASLPGVSQVSPLITTPITIVPPAASKASSYRDAAVGVELNDVKNLPVSLLAGRFPGTGTRTEVAVTQSFLDRVNLNAKQPAAALGKEFELGSFRATRGNPSPSRWNRVVIVGVVAQEAGQGQVLLPLDQARLRRNWSEGGGDPLRPAGVTTGYSGLVVVADGLDQVHPVREKLSDMGYVATAPEQLIATVQRYLHVVDLVLAGIGLVALGIASLAIAAAMLAAVRERRREIAIIKALGGRDGDVMRWFLVEALLIGTAGGVLGTAFGVAIARTLGGVVNRYLQAQGLEGVSVGLPLRVAVIGVGSAAVISLLAAVLPAWRAARLPAREAVGT